MKVVEKAKGLGLVVVGNTWIVSFLIPKVLVDLGNPLCLTHVVANEIIHDASVT